MVAASEEREDAGSQAYQDHHFGKILKEGFSFSGFERDHLWWNDGSGKFLDISGLSGTDSPTDGRGAAYGDLDNDGDMDIVRTSFQGPTHLLYRNNVGQDAEFLRVDLVGTTSGRDAYGALVRAHTSHGVQTRLKAGGSGYVSSGDPRLLFGLGTDQEVTRLEVDWPSGASQSFGPFMSGESIRIVEGRDDVERLAETRFSLPEPPGTEETMASKLRVNRGDRFPDLALTDASGGAVTLDEARQSGSLTLVNLWATWCVPCRKEMPALQALSEELGQGLSVIGLSVDTGASQQQVARTAKRLGVTYPVFTTEEPVYPHIFSGEEVFIPLTYLVDEAGLVVEVISGWSEAAEQRVRALVR